MVNGNEKIVSTGTDYSWMMSQEVGDLAPENLTTALALSYLIEQGAPMPYGSWITNMIQDGWHALESTCFFGGIPSDALNTNRIETNHLVILPSGDTDDLFPMLAQSGETSLSIHSCAVMQRTRW